MIGLLTRNLGLKFLALAVAFAFWLNVASEPEMVTIVSVPVEYSHRPENLEISSPITETIDVEASGPAGQIRALRDAHLVAAVDLSSVRAPGERTFTITPSEVRLPRGIAFVRATPAQLRFLFEKPLTKQVFVDAPLSGRLPPGFTLQSVEVNPPTLEISGPLSHVEAVKKLSADPFDLTQVHGDTQQIVSVYAGGPEVRIVGDPRVTVKVHVQPAR
jgi:YbbR domain-containing protein